MRKCEQSYFIISRLIPDLSVNQKRQLLLDLHEAITNDLLKYVDLSVLNKAK